MTGAKWLASRWGLAAGAAMLATASPASAGGPGDMFDVAFGAAVASDYVYRGVSQTDGGPAVQGYVELTYGMAYVGVWASNVDFGTPDAEIDLSVGIRPELDNAGFDLGYAHYFYADNTSPDYGEFYGLAEYYATEALTVGGNLYLAPDYSREGGSAAFVGATADVALIGNFGLSGGVGYQAFASKLGLPDYATWNAGVYWNWDDTVTLDLRYIDSDLSKRQCAELMSRGACGARFMATLSVDTSLSALRGN